MLNLKEIKKDIENNKTSSNTVDSDEVSNKYNSSISNNSSANKGILTQNNKINITLPAELKKCQELINWLDISESKTHHMTSLVSLFTIASAVTARGYFTETRASTSLYMILIGKTGLGKNTIYKIPNDILNQLHQDNKVITSKITSEGAIDDLFRNQNIIIHIIKVLGLVM